MTIRYVAGITLMAMWSAFDFNACAVIVGRSAQVNDFASINLMPPVAGTCKDSEIDVLVVSTKGSLTDTGKTMIEVTRNAFKDSKLDVAVNATYHIVQGKTSNSALDDVIKLAEGSFPNVHALRKQESADVVALIGDSYYDCGAAKQIGASMDQAFMVVSSACESRGLLSFAHELGHLAGAAHNGETEKIPFEYAHGYVESGKKWGTIMGIGACDGCTLNRWSNPNATHYGKNLGSANYADNVKLWGMRAKVMAGFLCKGS